MSKSCADVELFLAQQATAASLNRKIIYLAVMQLLSGIGILIGIIAVVLAQFTGIFGEDKYAVMLSTAFMTICAFFSASWHARRIEVTKRKLDWVKRSITTCPKCGAYMLAGSLHCTTCSGRTSKFDGSSLQKMGYPS
jgi:hypothetical protein